MYPFRDGCFAPRNGWYVAAFAHEIGRELLGRWILDEPVVLYRTEAGEAVALDGRCPHRHFPLAKSCLVGDEIQCGYHGIRFGSDGKCTRIPAQTVIPGTYKVRKYPVVEHGLWLFIWPGDPDQADPALLPDLEAIGMNIAGFRYDPLFVLDVEGRYQLLNDNLLDLTHLAYLHASSIGVEGNASTPEEREESDLVLKSRRFMRGVPIAPAHRGNFDYDGPIDRITGMDFYLPGFHAGLDISSIPEDHPTRAGEVLRHGVVFHAVTPGKRNTTNYFFAMGGVMSEEEVERARVGLAPVLDEDAMATREIEAMLTALGRYPDELMLKSDAGAVQGRRKLQAMMDREAAAAG